MFDWCLTRDEEKELSRDQNITMDRMSEHINKVYELLPVDGRKSFNNRCKVIETGNRMYLMSYSTLVCYWDINTSSFVRLWWGYSATTMRHINAFMRHIGFHKLGGKKWWESLKCCKEYKYTDLMYSFN